MDSLIARFGGLGVASKNVVDYLYMVDGMSVFCSVPIAKGTILGEIIGEPRYIWEIDHDRYIIVDQDYVLDVSDTLGGIARIREENSTMNMANCTVMSMVDEGTGAARFFFQATVDIPAHTELVYYVISSMM